MIEIYLLAMIAAETLLIVGSKDLHRKNLALLLFELTISLLCFVMGHGALAFGCFLLAIISAFIFSLLITNYHRRHQMEERHPNSIIRGLGCLVMLAMGVGLGILIWFNTDQFFLGQTVHQKAIRSGFSTVMASALVLLTVMMGAMDYHQRRDP